MTNKKRNTKTNAKKTNKRHALSKWNLSIMGVCVLSSFAIGICSGDPVIGSVLLMAGMIDSYLSCNQKRQGYIFGAIYAILLAYLGLVNHLYGSFFLNAFIYAPLQITGLFAWGKYQDRNHNVRIRKLTPKNAFILITMCTAGSLTVGYGLTMVPSQQMAFLDSAVCCIQIAALIVQNLRYAEAWWLWVVADIFAISMWRIAYLEGGGGAFMSLLTTITFFGFDVYGLIKWHHRLAKKKAAKKQPAPSNRRTK